MQEVLTLVSVIVPTWNSSRTINLCLQSIDNQTHKKTEILVIDGGSTDNTVEIAQKHRVQIVKLNKHGRSLQRNMGVLHAKGELLLHIDSDEVLHPKLIDDCISKVVNERFDVLFIPTIDTGHSYIGKSRCLGDIINLMLRKEAKIPNSALRFCTKDSFRTVGGYDEDMLVGEDVVFALKCLGQRFKVGKCKYPLLHYGTEGLRNIFLKKYAYGKTFKRFKERAKKFNVSPSREYVKVGLVYFRNLFKFKDYTRYIPGFFLVKLAEMLGLILGDISTGSLNALGKCSRQKIDSVVASLQSTVSRDFQFLAEMIVKSVASLRKQS